MSVVRLRTTFWWDNRGGHMKKSLTTMKRLTNGFDLLIEDMSMIGAEDVMTRIINLDSCADGLYKLIPVNEKRDWETGYIDDYDYKLIPYQPEGA